MSEGQEHTYIAIDLKSFYASVECWERGLDPLTTNLVVADLCRSQKTICLAVSPSLKDTGSRAGQRGQTPCDRRQSLRGELLSGSGARGQSGTGAGLYCSQAADETL